MAILFRPALIVVAALAWFATNPEGRAAEPPVSIIFDTDVDHDCDDIGAFYILHGAVEHGEARLLATIGCTSSDSIAPCLDAINTWFGRPEIPVGTLKDEGLLDHEGFGRDIADRYPRKFASGEDYPDATTIYRRILTDQPDGSVVLLTVGPLRNLANLLRSPPDEASPLDGKALVARKVKRLEVMGGNYPPSNAKEAEWNFKQDPASAALVCSDWPTPILFNGEGGSTCSGRRVTYEMPEHNPLTMAYRLYPGVGFAGDRLSWDSVSAMVATRGASPFYEEVGGGANVTDPVTGVNVWKADEDRGHSYLVLKSRKPEVETALEEMQTAGRGRPTDLKFDTTYYADAGMCQIICSGERNDQGMWQDRAATSWIEYRHVDGRKRLLTSYAVECNNKYRLPRALELSGSNDHGASWTVLDAQAAPGFSEETPRREFVLASPAKWNAYRLTFTAIDEAEGTQVDSIELNERIHCRPGMTVTSVSLDHGTLALPMHDRATLNATVAPLDAFERVVVWTSGDSEVAEVRQVGEQTAIVVGKAPGACEIKATVDGVQQTCRVTVGPATLPPGWEFNELNVPPIPGSATASGGEFTLTGCGHAMTSWWERVRDQGTFASRTADGDVSLSARLTGLAPNVGGPSYKWDNRPSSASGLMIRESLSEAAGRYLAVQVDASGRLACRWRDKTGDQDDNQVQELGTVELPVHLKIVQASGKVRMFASVDGKDWGEPRLTRDVTFGEESRIGLFVCSGNTFAATTAVFDSVELGE